ncbi:protein-cysteine N-palmitoyltransferase HHAT-like protein, partial [Argonauta hians]
KNQFADTSSTLLSYYARGLHAPLPTVEIVVYFVTMTTAIIFICVAVFLASLENFDKLNPSDFSSGWTILNSKKDISESEWSLWNTWLQKVGPFLLGHIIIARLIEVKFFSLRKYFFLSYSMMSLMLLIGWKPLAMLFLQCSVIYLASKMASHKLIWIISIAFLSLLNFETSVIFLQTVLFPWTPSLHQQYYFTMIIMSLCNIRYTSFCLEYSTFLNSKTQHQVEETSENVKRNNAFSFSDLLCYTVYLPLCFSGPLINYDEFHQQMSKPCQMWSKKRLKSHVFDFLRIGGWALCFHIILHYFYYDSMSYNLVIVESLSQWTLVGIGYCQGQFFMVKYLIIWGVASSIAKLDQFQPPRGPRCISYVYLYSEMWRDFDRGLYSFMKKYIYVPAGGSRNGTLRQLTASALSFCFVFYWHGMRKHLFIWSIMNFIVVSLESFSKKILYIPFISTIWVDGFTPSIVRRIHAVAALPTLLTSHVAIFYFMNGTTVGDIFLVRLILKAEPYAIVYLLVCLYAAIQVGMEAKRYEFFKQNLKPHITLYESCSMELPAIKKE